jgi:aminoglycoside N3'-acetyltransferase
LIDSVSAFGPAARYLTSTHSVTNCGADSPYQKLIATDAQILLLGVSHNSNTTFEAVEEELAPSYVKFKDIPGARIIDEGGEERLLPTKRQDFEYSSDFNKLNGKLIRAGAQSEIVIGEAIVRRVSAAKLHEVVRRAIEADTFVVRLRDGEQPLPEIPTSIHDLPA